MVSLLAITPPTVCTASWCTTPASAGDPSASGQLTVHDVDTGEDHFATPASLRTIELGLRLQHSEGRCIQRSWDDGPRSPSVSPLCWLVDDADRGAVARAELPHYRI
jgi:hypothetical protein